MEPRRGDGEGHEGLSDSWIEMQLTPLASRKGSSSDLDHSAATLEKLLKDAQREHLSSSPVLSLASHASSHHSPKELLSPSSESPIHVPIPGQRVLSEQQITEWMWDWSSRPENIPPCDFGQLKHPDKPLDVARDKERGRHSEMVGLWSMPLMTTLLVTHACTFTVGAALMLLLVRRYYS